MLTTSAKYGLADFSQITTLNPYYCVQNHGLYFLACIFKGCLCGLFLQVLVITGFQWS